MAFSLPKIIAKATEHLANREQRIVTVVFVAAAALYLGSYMPEAWAWLATVLGDSSYVSHLLASWTWPVVLRNMALVAFTLCSGMALLIAYMRIFNARWDDLQAMYFLKDHTIICGMSTRGKIMAQSIAKKNGQVVIIDIAELHEIAAEHRSKGIYVLHGDATLLDTLKDAGLYRAKNIVCLTDKDETNVMVLESVRRAMAEPGARAGRGDAGKLVCYCHVADQNLSRHMQELPPLRAVNPEVTYRTFNIHSITAAELLRRYPLDAIHAGQAALQFRATLIGSRQFASALAYEMAQQCHYPVQGAGQEPPKPVLTIVNEQARDIVQSIRDECAAIGDLVHIEEKQIAFSQLGQLEAFVQSLPNAGCIYVALDDEISTLSVASLVQRVVRRSELAQISVVAVTPPKSVRLDVAQWQGAGAVPVVEAYQSVTADVALEGARDKMAQGVHEHYFSKLQQEGGLHTPPRPAERHWHELDDFLRESNRQQVAHLAIKLRVLGVRIVPDGKVQPNRDSSSLAAVAAGTPVFEAVARMEHQRWMAFHLVRGWQQAKAGQTRNDALKIHDCLISFDELSQKIADYDRDTVKNLPMLCADAGLRLERVSQTP